MDHPVLAAGNTAVITGGESRVLGPDGPWQDIFETNLWGVIHGSQVFPRTTWRRPA